MPAATMLSMANQPEPRPRNPWLPAFVLSIAALSGSLLALAFVLVAAISDGNTRQPGAEATPTPAAEATPGPLTFSGPLPPGAAGLGLIPAETGQTPDIEFAQGDGAGSVVTRYFVLVAALGAGVDSLTREQLADLASGAITDWSEVGGLERQVQVSLVNTADLRSYIEPLVLARSGPSLSESLTVFESLTSYEVLREAMAVDSGILSVVPLEELSPGMVALAIDGVDIARGTGDPAEWPFAERWRVEAHTPAGEGHVQEVRAAIAAGLPEITTVVATGDILMSRCSLAAIEASGDWGAALRGPVGEYLAAADLALGSLDGSIQDIAEPYGCIVMEFPNLTSPPEVIEGLTVAGIDGVTIATNHIFDCAEGGCGSQAMLRTIELLNEAGIKTVGGGANLEEAFAPAIFEVNGLKFGVLGFDDIAAEHLQATETDPGTAPLDDSYEDEQDTPPEEPAFYKPAELLALTRFEERIRKLKEEVDVVIMQVQSGYEDTHDPSPRSLKALRAAVDAGADLVVGNQAHWVQGIELRGSAFIAYALGNFIFDQTRTPEHTQGYLLEATFHGAKLATVRLVPYEIEERYKPVFVEGETRAEVLGDVVDASAGLPE
jgi:poly-gamma-glutamate synthesis protein (capsule biosynthesis protein)